MKKYRFTFLLAIVGLGFVLSTCNENTIGEDLTVIKGFNYYPIEVGKYITYELDSIIYRQPSCACVPTSQTCGYPFIRDTSSYQLREEVVEIYTDNTGAENYVIERYLRSNANEPWSVADVWNTKISNTQVERVEENLRFIKLVFPVSENVSWNGNAFFRDTAVVIGTEVVEFYEHWSLEYEYGDIDVAEEINGIMFDSVMTVIQSAPSENKINHRSSIEKYARGVGLVYKEMLILDTQCCVNENLTFCDDIPWEEKGERGLVLRQRIIDFN